MHKSIFIYLQRLFTFTSWRNYNVCQSLYWQQSLVDLIRATVPFSKHTIAKQTTIASTLTNVVPLQHTLLTLWGKPDGYIYSHLKGGTWSWAISVTYSRSENIPKAEAGNEIRFSDLQEYILWFLVFCHIDI